MKQELKNYGLSEKEIEIYLACLKSGEATSNRLSELTNIRRSTVYEVIETLKKKGIIHSIRKNKKYYFIAVKPQSLIDLLRDRERNILEILPDLNKLIGVVTQKPKSELFEGIASIKQVVLEMLNYKEILIYGGSTVGDEIFGSFTSNFAKRRVEKGIKMKAVIGQTIPEHMLEKDVKKFTQIKTIKDFENHNSVYFIYGDNLLIISMGEELIAVKITSKILVESQRKIFELLWRFGR